MRRIAECDLFVGFDGNVHRDYVFNNLLVAFPYCYCIYRGIFEMNTKQVLLFRQAGKSSRFPLHSMFQRVSLDRNGLIITETLHPLSIAIQNFDSNLTGGGIRVKRKAG